MKSDDVPNMLSYTLKVCFKVKIFSTCYLPRCLNWFLDYLVRFPIDSLIDFRTIITK